MALKAIIIRADGALAETEGFRRQAFERVFGEAGIEWVWDEETFVASQGLGTARSRMSQFVRQALKGRPETQDLSQLITAMDRRAAKVFDELIASAPIEPRAGIREVVAAARQERLELVASSLLKATVVETLLRKTLGEWAVGAVKVVSTGEIDDAAAANQRLYSAVADQLSCPHENSIVLEATTAGSAAARATGFPVVTAWSAFCSERRAAGSAADFEVLQGLISPGEKRRHQPLSADDRTMLLARLQGLQSTGTTDGRGGTDGRDGMRVANILAAKGSAVKTIEPAASMRAFADGLRTAQVGAMVVSDKGDTVEGIISERDLVRGLAEFGADLPTTKVSRLMTRSVITCAPEDSLATVARIMTQKRIRHLPVVVGGALVGLVSIGDVLKHRLDEMQLEANVLRDFAIARR